jgi:hypothetical protein
VTESAPHHDTAAALPTGDAAAALSGRTARQLLDAAVARTIAALAHDLRNSLGVVSMQVEAIAVRAASPLMDLSAIQGHAAVAADHIERLADMTNALIAFARGRTSSDLSVIMAEAAALVPLRPVLVVKPSVATVGMDAMLTRAVALEVLVLALGQAAAPTFTVTAGTRGATLDVTSGAPLTADDALEWVVQFIALGGTITTTEDGIRLLFPPIA